jgi:hypothetical protein
MTLRIITVKGYAEWRFAECHAFKCCAECRHAEWIYTKCHYSDGVALKLPGLKWIFRNLHSRCYPALRKYMQGPTNIRLG